MDPGSERRLAAILFTDIVGSAAVTARSESAGLALRDRHRELVRTQVERYHGRFIEAPGDESLSTFDSAVDAVHAALAIQQELEGDAELQVHIGLHLGETVFRGDEVFGDGVNVAARLYNAAPRGEIYISGALADALRGQEHLELAPRGDQTFRNVARPVAVYAVTGTPAEPTPLLRATPGRRTALRPFPLTALVLLAIVGGFAWWLWPLPPSVPIRSIAVLPLENLSGDPEQEYFADGMTEALISEFAQIEALPVISRTSVMQYKKVRKPLPEIANELGVEWILEGTVLRAGDQVRITVQLIDGPGDLHLWSDAYDRDLSDMLAVHSEVARAVAGQVEAVLSPDEESMLAATRQVDPAAYDEYLRGLAIISSVRGTKPAAIAHFQRAVELDPRFADAWARLARAEFLRSAGFLASPEWREGALGAARVAATRALEIDASLGEATATLGLVRIGEWDLLGAGPLLERAVHSSPGNLMVLSAYSRWLVFVGRVDQALVVAERMRRIAPLDQTVRRNYAAILYYARQHERALEEFHRILETDPEAVDFHMVLAYAVVGPPEDYHRAWMAFFRQAALVIPEVWEPLVEARERGWKEGGLEGARLAMLPVALELGKQGRLSPVIIADLFADLGQLDEAFVWLERAWEQRDTALMGLKVAPTFDPFRSDPRYDDLVRRVGFPES